MSIEQNIRESDWARSIGAIETMPVSPLAALRRAVAEGSEGYIESDDGRMGFAELDRRSDRYAAFFASLGIGKGDRIACQMGNSLDHITACLAAAKIGGIWAAVNTEYVGAWLEHQLRDTAPSLYIADAQYLKNLATIDRAVLGGCPVIVRADESGDLGEGIDFGRGESFAPIADRHEPAPADISHLIYTSGTTGRSKGVAASHQYLCNYARLGFQNAPRRPDEVLWTYMPLFHVGGLSYVIQTLMIGGRMHLARRFSLSSFWFDVERAGASVIPLLGVAVPLIAAAPDNEASRRYYGKVRLLTGTSVLETADKISRRFGVQKTVTATFGQSEGAWLLTLAGKPYRNGTCGCENDSFEVRIVDEHDEPVADGEVGEFVFRPLRANVMSAGYWRNPEATAAKSRNLWWHTGDLGKRDSDGYFYFVDRGDDRLRRSGENISSMELEAAFAAHDDIAALAAVAVDTGNGEEIKLSVVCKAGATLTEAALWAWSKDRVPRFAVPRFIEFREALPQNPVGKILKGVLRQEGVSTACWDSRQTVS